MEEHVDLLVDSRSIGRVDMSRDAMLCASMSSRPRTDAANRPTGGTTELAPAERIRRRVRPYAQSWQCPTFAFMDAAASDGGMLQ